MRWRSEKSYPSNFVGACDDEQKPQCCGVQIVDLTDNRMRFKADRWTTYLDFLKPMGSLGQRDQ